MEINRPRATATWLWMALFGLLACGWCETAFAATIDCGDAHAEAGEAGVWLSVSLASSDGEAVCGIQFDLTFAEEALSLDDVTAGQAAIEASKDVQFSMVKPGHARVLVVGFNQYVIDDGVVAYLQFSVAPDALDGIYPVTPTSPLLSDPYGIALPGATLSGVIVVGDGGLGAADVNEDGVRNAVDVQLVVNCALGFFTEYDCDVNQDGTVNAVDIQAVINGVLAS